jgi:superfamily II DNA/RNA helicase
LANGPSTNAQLTELKRETLKIAGSEDRLIWAELDGPIRNISDPWHRGEKILRTVLDAVAEIYRERAEIFVEGEVPTPGFPALQAKEAAQSVKMVERIHLAYLGGIRRVLRPASLAGTTTTETNRAFSEGNQLVKDCWAGGIFHAESLPTQAASALAVISRNIARALSPGSKYSMTVDDSDPLMNLVEGPRALGKRLADKFLRNGDLLEHRRIVEERLGYTQTGILDNGTTELDRIAVDRIFRAPEQQSFFVYAPTSSGKTRLALLAILEAVNTCKKATPGTYGRALFLAPTKALVAQIAGDLQELVKGTEAESWRIIEGTRDHPQYNQVLRTGRFDIAVVIPEKLAAMLRVGMNLDQCSLLVIDEMQHIVDGQRGTDLELLLLDIFQEYPDLRWVGLSASLGSNTRGLMHRWLESNNSKAEEVPAVHRPVPLTVSAVDPQTTYTRAIHIGGKPTESWTGPSRLKKAIGELEPESRRIAEMYSRPLEQLFKVLKEFATDGGPLRHDEVPSILFFVSSKDNARKLAAAVADIMESVFPNGVNATAAPEPYVRGRFTRFTTLKGTGDPAVALEEFEQLGPGRLKDSLRWSIVTGVGFHTATLDSHARQIVEAAFLEGYIRILFATDTLKLGVNLPSDVVINGDMQLSASEGYRMLDRDTVIQRLGRAGRLGLKHQGHGYLVAPETFPPTPRIAANLYIGPEELLGLGDGDERKVTVAIHQAEKIFDHYLADWSAGAEYMPQPNDKWFELAMLRKISALAVRSSTLDSETLEEHARAIHARTLAGANGSSFPTGFLERLERESCIKSHDGKILLTATGYALAVNSLSVDNASAVGSIGKAVTNGAGPFTLLFLAAQASASQRSTRAMSSDNFPPGIQSAILKAASALSDVDRQRHPRYFRHFTEEVTDVFGTGPQADTLRYYAAQDSLTGDAAAPVLTALWRAAVLLHRWAGRELGYLEGLVGSDSWIPDEVAIQQVADSVAFVLEAASDQLGTSPTDMSFRTLQFFAAEVETGLPLVLSRITRSNLRGITRERLLGLLDYLDEPEPRWDSVEELLDRYMTERMFRPRTAPGRSKRSSPTKWAPLRPATLDRLKRRIAQGEKDRRFFSTNMPDPWGSHRIPRGWDKTLADDLRDLRANRKGSEVITALLVECGFDVNDVDEHPGRLAVRRSSTSELVTYIEIAEELLRNEDIESALATLGPDENLMLISIHGASDGVMHRAQFQRERCTIVEPSLFMEMIARVYERHYIEGDAFAGQDGTLDPEGSEAMLTIMFRNNAPVLTRTDLENRMRSSDLVVK